MSDEKDLKICRYISPGGLSCKRAASDGDHCIFHHGCNRKSDEEPLPNPQFQSGFDLLLEQKDGNWDGFVFPSEFKLPNRIDFPVNFRWAFFAILDLNNTTFLNTVDFSDAIFLGKAIFHTVIFKCQAASSPDATRWNPGYLEPLLPWIPQGSIQATC